MTYDHWKTTEPEHNLGDPRPSPDEEHITYLEARNAVYEAALRKIAAWKGYEPHDAHWRDQYVVDQYERGANDMLTTLEQMAEEALG